MYYVGTAQSARRHSSWVNAISRVNYRLATNYITAVSCLSIAKLGLAGLSSFDWHRALSTAPD